MEDQRFMLSASPAIDFKNVPVSLSLSALFVAMEDASAANEELSAYRFSFDARSGHLRVLQTSAGSSIAIYYSVRDGREATKGITLSPMVAFASLGGDETVVVYRDDADSYLKLARKELGVLVKNATSPGNAE
jgi:hypothetical protein